jgi:hypothetical protein
VTVNSLDMSPSRLRVFTVAAAAAAAGGAQVLVGFPEEPTARHLILLCLTVLMAGLAAGYVQPPRRGSSPKKNQLPWGSP